MNNTSRYIANLYYVMLQARNTLEFCLKRDHNVKFYNARKQVLQESMEPHHGLRNLLDSNPEVAKVFEPAMRTLLEDVYGGEDAVVHAVGEEVRIDHTQHLRIYQVVIPVVEQMKDMIGFYLRHAKTKNEEEPVIIDLMKADDSLYRAVCLKFLMGDLANSFFEFNKVMQESKGKPTPQSNFIAQNEMAVYLKLVRSVRGGTRIIDNKSLDLFDECVQICEMMEGRRERRDNKPMNQIITENQNKLTAYINEADQTFIKAFQPVLEDMKAQAEAAKSKMSKEVPTES